MKKDITHGPQIDSGIKDWRFFLLFLAFILIIGFFLFTLFSGVSFSDITGYSIIDFGGEYNPNKSIDFSAELTTPFLELDGEYEKIDITGSSDGTLSTSGGDFDLGKHGKVFIELNNFEGEITINSGQITELDGKTDSMILNGVEITPKSKRLNLEIKESFDYDSLEIFENVFIKEINYLSSGKVIIDNEKRVFNLEGEEITIQNFYGSINVKPEEIKLDGSVEFFESIGTSRVSVKK